MKTSLLALDLRVALKSGWRTRSRRIDLLIPDFCQFMEHRTDSHSACGSFRAGAQILSPFSRLLLIARCIGVAFVNYYEFLGLWWLNRSGLVGSNGADGPGQYSSCGLEYKLWLSTDSALDNFYLAILAFISFNYLTNYDYYYVCVCMCVCIFFFFFWQVITNREKGGRVG